MKLRNKETGGLANILGEQDFFRVYTDAGWADYNSLAELNEEWEDYEPPEPIEDGKMRQCVKMWSELNGFKGELIYTEGDGWCSFYEEDEDEELLFRNLKCPNLKDRERYLITDLCGEEEE